MPRELEGEVAECPKCLWTHRPSQPCPKSKPPQGPLAAKVAGIAGLDPYAKFKDWEASAQAQPTTREPAGRHCPVCGQPIVICRNFLGIIWEEVGTDLWDERQRACQAQSLPDLKPPRRAGLPYRDDTND